MEITESHARLGEMIRSREHWTQGIELCRALGMSAPAVMDLLGFKLAVVEIPEGTDRLGPKDEAASKR